MALDKISLCNLALGEVPADPITSFEERGASAEWCARLYAPTLAYVIDLHDWKLPRKRSALAQIDNDRPAEWAYAYEVPNDCIQELRVLPTFDGSWPEVPLLVGQALAPWVVTSMSIPALYRYLVAGTTIYSNIPTAVLEYITATPSEQGFRPLFARGFLLELASRLVMPLKGSDSSRRQGELIKMAEVAIDRAIADDLNRDESASSYGDFVNDTELARGGASFGYSPHPYWPVG